MSTKNIQWYGRTAFHKFASINSMCAISTPFDLARQSALFLLTILHTLGLYLTQLFIVHTSFAVMAVLVRGREAMARTVSLKHHCTDDWGEQTWVRMCSSPSTWHRNNRTALASVPIPELLHRADSQLDPRPCLRPFVWITAVSILYLGQRLLRPPLTLRTEGK